jgi:hypothetical protein
MKGEKKKKKTHEASLRESSHKNQKRPKGKKTPLEHRASRRLLVFMCFNNQT